MENPPNHHFIVFSVINDDNSVVPRYSQCNNCGIVHKVIDFCRSEIVVGKESMMSIMTIDDIKTSLSENIVNILEINQADLPTWEMVKFIIENQQWGNIAVLTTDSDDETLKQGKYIQIVGEKLAKVESFVREEVIG